MAYRLRQWFARNNCDKVLDLYRDQLIAEKYYRLETRQLIHVHEVAFPISSVVNKLL